MGTQRSNGMRMPSQLSRRLSSGPPRMVPEYRKEHLFVSAAEFTDEPAQHRCPVQALVQQRAHLARSQAGTVEHWPVGVCPAEWARPVSSLSPMQGP